MNDGLDGLLGLFTFDEKNMLCYINYVSSITDKMYNYQNQFVWDFKGNTSILSKTYYPDGIISNDMKTSSREEILDTFVYGKTVSLKNSSLTSESVKIAAWLIIVALAVGAGSALILKIKKDKNKTEAAE